VRWDPLHRTFIFSSLGPPILSVTFCRSSTLSVSSFVLGFLLAFVSRPGSVALSGGLLHRM